MIGPDEIRKQALSWWKPFLQSYVAGTSFFPKVIDRIGKVKPGHMTENFEALREQIAVLYLHSKLHKVLGYEVRTAKQTFRRKGSHDLPDSIVFDTIEDYVDFVRLKQEWASFQRNYESVVAIIPSLKEWVYQHVLLLTDEKVVWSDILKVCQYFILNPRPHLYLRQLPIDVHTKFIEHNAALIQSLLQYLIPGDVRDAGQQRFAERFYLRYDEPLIRIRVLDPALLFVGGIADISIPLSDFQQMNMPVQRIIITENKMNFLTLPAVTGAMAIWSGGGFNVAFLRDIEWMKDVEIFYWGDIDEHGYQILHQIRSYYNKVKSLMMDRATYELFKYAAVMGARNKSEQLEQLTNEEGEMYQALKQMDSGNRLEQEKILQGYIEEFFKLRFG